MSDGSNEGEGFEFGSPVWGISVSDSGTASSLVWDLEAVISHILADQEAGDRVGSRAEL